MYNNVDFDMGTYDTFVLDGNVVTIELGLDERGRSVYRISWYNGHSWKHTYYRRNKEAWATYKMITDTIREMVED